MEEKKTFWWLEKILFKIHFRKFSKCYYMKGNHCKSITQYQIFVKSIFKMKISIIFFFILPIITFSLFEKWIFQQLQMDLWSTGRNSENFIQKWNVAKHLENSYIYQPDECMSIRLEWKIFEMKFSISKRLLSKNSFWIVSWKKNPF